MKLSLACATVLALMLPGKALAECASADALLKQAYPEAQHGNDGLLVKGGAFDRSIQPRDVVCKAWPSRPELMLAAVPLIEAPSHSDGETKGDVEIIIADPATAKPIARRLEKGMAFADAVRFESMKLDTARYDLGKGVRAFGLRTSQSGSSSVDPFGEQALWLYTYDRGRIDRVLDGLVVERFNGENDRDCKAGWSTTVKRSVKLGSTGKSAYRNLAVEQTVIHEKSKKVGNECQFNKRQGKMVRFQLIYDKGRYRLAAGRKPRSEHGGVEGLFSIIEIQAP